MKKMTAFLLPVFLLAVLSISGTLAFVQSNAQENEWISKSNLVLNSASPVVLGTKGDVSTDTIQIEQLEYERGGAGLQTFTDGKFLYPAVHTAETEKTVIQSWNSLGIASGTSQLWDSGWKNVVDKFVFVRNGGNVPVYVRTWFAFEEGNYGGNVLEKLIQLNFNDTEWTRSTPAAGVKIGENTYTVFYADLQSTLASGKTSMPSLLQVYMSSEAKNQDVMAVDGNGNEQYEILIFSHAAESSDVLYDAASAKKYFASMDLNGGTDEN